MTVDLQAADHLTPYTPGLSDLRPLGVNPTTRVQSSGGIEDLVELHLPSFL